VVALAACQDTPAAFGPTPATARTRADQLFAGLEERFTRIDRSAASAAAVSRVERAVFTPSKVYDDSSVWNAIPADTVRLLSVAGHFVRDQYVIAEVARAPLPDELAASRDEIRLTRLGRGQFEWTTFADQVIGSVSPDDVARVTAAMLAAVASSNDDALRAGSALAFPRSSAVLGKLFSLDTIRRVPGDDGTVMVDLAIGLHPDSLTADYPAFAAFLRRYLDPTRLHWVLRDSVGAEWFDLELGAQRLDVRFRANHDGRFAPFDGTPRSMPDSLMLEWDFRTKIWIFPLSLSALASDFRVLHTPHARGWSVGFRHEPRWHLPLAVDHLLKASLRRPFAGDGAYYRVVVTDSGGRTTRLERAGSVIVQEGSLVRWLGRLAGRALGEFFGPAEAQESAYLAAVFHALRMDVQADLGAGSGEREAGSG